jgi:hypothetical protein
VPPLTARGKLHSKNVIGGNAGIVENTQYIQLDNTTPFIRN